MELGGKKSGSRTHVATRVGTRSGVLGRTLHFLLRLANFGNKWSPTWHWVQVGNWNATWRWRLLWSQYYALLFNFQDGPFDSSLVLSGKARNRYSTASKVFKIKDRSHVIWQLIRDRGLTLIGKTAPGQHLEIRPSWQGPWRKRVRGLDSYFEKV